MNLSLIINYPDGRSETQNVEGTKVTIGRSESCDVVLPLQNISSRHATLGLEGDRWILRDLNSTNGTFVKDQQLNRPYPVESGTQFQLAEEGPIVQVVILSTNQNGKKNGRLSYEATGDNSPSNFPQHSRRPSSPDLHPASTPFQAIPPLKPSSQPADPNAWPEPVTTNHVRLHWFSAAIILALTTLTWAGFYLYTEQEPARGYTAFGVSMGLLATAILTLVILYLARKRKFQEFLPGSLKTWLILHVWLSVLSVILLAFHSGFHLDGRSGTWTSIALAGTFLTGVLGWALYSTVPGQVARQVGNLSVVDAAKQILMLEHRIEDMVAGRSVALKTLANEVLSASHADQIEQHRIAFNHSSDLSIADQICQAASEHHDWKRILRKQTRYRMWMRGWLALHIPLALGFVVLLPWHIWDAMELKWYVFSPGPKDFASPDTCYECHKDQYNEWSGSMHAIAQLSPVTDLQNYLVVLKDRHDNGKNGVIVGDLCVKCHAPTSRLGSKSQVEDEILPIEERAPAGHFGVSCVACHQISQIHETRPFDEDKDQVDYKNAENLVHTPGRCMFGPETKDANGDARTPVGNSEHRGSFGSHFKESSFCASCHTVMVDPEGENNLVTLQNTYHEWKESGNDPGKGLINWSTKEVNCIDCHGKPLDDLVALASQMQKNSDPLEERRQRFVRAVVDNKDKPLPKDKQFAASTDQKYDLPLAPIRTHLHTFTGVDYHLEDNLPFSPGHPRFEDNAKIQRETVANVDKLLKIAAAVKIIDKQDFQDELKVDVLNLATGHHLPAGFAFAREMWLEVSVSNTRDGEDFQVIAGGKDRRPLEPHEQLNKYEEGPDGRLKNFQAVLWNGEPGRLKTVNGKQVRTGETVLQNECVKVLKGDNAVKNGFQDRENFLLPGEIRTITIKGLGDELDELDGYAVKRIRVRLRFRNYPPEFLEQLADRFLADRNHLWTDKTRQAGFVRDSEMWQRDEERAERTRAMIDKLRIFEMAEDTIEIPYT